MKYAIASKGKSLEAGIDTHFGRCKYIVVYDLKTKGWEFIPNPFEQLDEGVGPLMVEMLHKKGIDKVVSGSFGIRIKELMDSKKMQMIIPKNGEITVSSIIEMIDHS
jgi:predicted Fe-Mo cluster-binding NifX family protein